MKIMRTLTVKDNFFKLLENNKLFILDEDGNYLKLFFDRICGIYADCHISINGFKKVIDIKLSLVGDRDLYVCFE